MEGEEGKDGLRKVGEEKRKGGSREGKGEDGFMDGEREGGEGRGGKEKEGDGWMEGGRKREGGREGRERRGWTSTHACTHTPPPVQHQRFVEWEESACSFSWHHWPCRERDTLSPHATPDLQTPCTYVHTVQYLRTVCT